MELQQLFQLKDLFDYLLYFFPLGEIWTILVQVNKTWREHVMNRIEYQISTETENLRSLMVKQNIEKLHQLARLAPNSINNCYLEGLVREVDETALKTAVGCPELMNAALKLPQMMEKVVILTDMACRAFVYGGNSVALETIRVLAMKCRETVTAIANGFMTLAFWKLNSDWEDRDSMLQRWDRLAMYLIDCKMDGESVHSWACVRGWKEYSEASKVSLFDNLMDYYDRYTRKHLKSERFGIANMKYVKLIRHRIP